MLHFTFFCLSLDLCLSFSSFYLSATFCQGSESLECRRRWRPCPFPGTRKAKTENKYFEKQNVFLSKRATKSGSCRRVKKRMKTACVNVSWQLGWKESSLSQRPQQLPKFILASDLILRTNFDDLDLHVFLNVRTLTSTKVLAFKFPAFKFLVGQVETRDNYRQACEPLTSRTL